MVLHARPPGSLLRLESIKFSCLWSLEKVAEESWSFLYIGRRGFLMRDFEFSKGRCMDRRSRAETGEMSRHHNNNTTGVPKDSFRSFFFFLFGQTGGNFQLLSTACFAMSASRLTNHVSFAVCANKPLRRYESLALVKILATRSCARTAEKQVCVLSLRGHS